MSFAKLKNKFVFNDDSLVVEHDSLVISHGDVHYHTVDLPVELRDMMYSVIPKEFHKFFTVFYVRGNGVLFPHVDVPSKCTVLFYNNPGNFRTSFYELVNESANVVYSNVVYSNVSYLSDEEQKNYVPKRVYKEEEVRKIGSYIAEPYDAYCLDGTTIHSVEKVDETTQSFRSALILDTMHFSFNQVLALLKQTDNI